MITALLLIVGTLLAGSQALADTPWGLGLVIGLALIVAGVARLDRTYA
jgi:ABC-type uncharacterized transport system permease subunit